MRMKQQRISAKVASDDAHGAGQGSPEQPVPLGKGQQTATHVAPFTVTEVELTPPATVGVPSFPCHGSGPSSNEELAAIAVSGTLVPLATQAVMDALVEAASPFTVTEHQLSKFSTVRVSHPPLLLPDPELELLPEPELDPSPVPVPVPLPDPDPVPDELLHPEPAPRPTATDRQAAERRTAVRPRLLRLSMRDLRETSESRVGRNEPFTRA